MRSLRVKCCSEVLDDMLFENLVTELGIRITHTHTTKPGSEHTERRQEQVSACLMPDETRLLAGWLGVQLHKGLPEGEFRHELFSVQLRYDPSDECPGQLVIGSDARSISVRVSDVLVSRHQLVELWGWLTEVLAKERVT